MVVWGGITLIRTLLNTDPGDESVNLLSQGLALVLADCCEHPDALWHMAANAARVFRTTFAAEKVYGEMMAYLEELTAARLHTLTKA